MTSLVLQRFSCSFISLLFCSLILKHPNFCFYLFVNFFVTYMCSYHITRMPAIHASNMSPLINYTLKSEVAVTRFIWLYSGLFHSITNVQDTCQNESSCYRTCMSHRETLLRTSIINNAPKSEVAIMLHL